MARWLYSASVPKSIPSALYSLILHKRQGIFDTYIPKRLPRQRHVSTRINVQLIRTGITTSLSRRHIRFAVIGWARRRTRVNDLYSNGIPYTADGAPYTTSMRDGITRATVARWAAWVRPTCHWALAIAFGEFDATGACSTRDIRGDVGRSGAICTALT